jgi:uncharacterized protein (TIGR00106 family)
MIAEFSISPVGESVSLSKWVAEVIRIVDESGLEHETNAMSTVVEGEWDAVMALIKKCHAKVLESSERAVTTIRIDDRKGARGRIKGKIESIEKRLGRKIRK